MKRYLTVLSIAGSDSCGGAGIQADTKTCCALGVYAMTAVTAVTAQNTCGVSAIMGISPEVVKAQIDAVFADIGVDAVKIGMLFNADIARAVAASLRQHKPRHIVLDPVMISTSGSQLIDNDAIEVLLGELMPISSIITPNRHEAERIASMPIACAADIEPAARKILAAGAKAVLMKGGHFSGDEMTDWLYLQGVDRPYVFSSPFCDTQNTHGTGCTLSSAIASFLALGNSLPSAVEKAKRYLSQALLQGASVSAGKGHGPVNHLYAPQPLKTTDL